MKTVHLAGNSVTIDGRVIQRCLVCGEKLCDSRGAMAPVTPDGSPTMFATFGVGQLIEVERVDEHCTRFLAIGDTETPQFDAAWLDCCIHLVE